ARPEPRDPVRIGEPRRVPRGRHRASPARHRRRAARRIRAMAAGGHRRRDHRPAHVRGPRERSGLLLSEMLTHHARARSALFLIFPDPVRGSSARKTISFGVLYAARLCFTNAISSAAVAVAPARSTTAAHTVSPRRASGRANTAHSETAA